MMQNAALNELEAARNCLRRGDQEGARSHCARLLSVDPDCAEALHLLSGVCAVQGDYDSALPFARRAWELAPGDLAIARNLGVVCIAARRWAEALDWFGRVLDGRPEDGAALLGYATAAHELGRHKEALSSSLRALAAGAPAAGARLLAARTLLALNRLDEAVAECARSIHENPQNARSYILLAEIYGRQKRFEDRLDCAAIAVRLEPRSAQALAHLGLAYADVGDSARSIALLRQSLALRPEAADVRSLFLTILLHDAGITPEQLLQEHLEWPRTHAANLPRFNSWANSPDPERRLRIGYVCGEFVQGPFAYFLLPVMSNHDHERFEICSYHCSPYPDAKTAEFRLLSDVWRDVTTVDDDALCTMIREDGIDILVDLSGHYPFTRLAAFARHPAPVQAAFPNYPSTTGVSEIDYILTDRWCAPDDDTHYVERPWRLDSGYLAYLPAPDLPPAGPLPALRNGSVTFGIFQRGAKLNEGVWDAVAAVLKAVPGSRLLIHNANVDIDSPKSRTYKATAAFLTRRGIAASRIDLRGDRPWREHLEVVSQCDIALDTFPYSGQTTTCDCLWMGVPVVTVAGRTHVARVGASILARAGLEDWIARSPAEYVDIAVRKSADVPGLAALRSRLRRQVAESPVGDGVRVARCFEAAYRAMWRAWCAAQSRPSPSPV